MVVGRWFRAVVVGVVSVKGSSVNGSLTSVVLLLELELELELGRAVRGVVLSDDDELLVTAPGRPVVKTVELGSSGPTIDRIHRGHGWWTYRVSVMGAPRAFVPVEMTTVSPS